MKCSKVMKTDVECCQSDESVEANAVFHLIGNEKGGCDRGGIREAGRLDQDAVKLARALV